MFHRLSMLLFLPVALIIAGCGAQPSGSTAVDDARPLVETAAATSAEALLAQVAEAYRQPEAARIEALMHPSSRACLQAEPRYRRYLLHAETAQPLPAAASAAIEAIAPDAVLPYRGFQFPLRPTHVLRFEFDRQETADGRGSLASVAEKHAIEHDGRWQLLFPCPTTEGMQRLQELGLLD